MLSPNGQFFKKNILFNEMIASKQASKQAN